MFTKKAFEPFKIGDIVCKESKGNRIVVGVGRSKAAQKPGWIRRDRGEDAHAAARRILASMDAAPDSSGSAARRLASRRSRASRSGRRC
mmetsp:Transcript_40445/g.130977  ORF Transcript_40445/g.130977 Transcript_40445/m.130977 type:complete len:89 (-) Transcript_40445:5-271(-)